MLIPLRNSFILEKKNLFIRKYCNMEDMDYVESPES